MATGSEMESNLRSDDFWRDLHDNPEWCTASLDEFLAADGQTRSLVKFNKIGIGKWRDDKLIGVMLFMGDKFLRKG